MDNSISESLESLVWAVQTQIDRIGRRTISRGNGAVELLVRAQNLINEAADIAEKECL